MPVCVTYFDLYGVLLLLSALSCFSFVLSLYDDNIGHEE